MDEAANKRIIEVFVRRIVTMIFVFARRIIFNIPVRKVLVGNGISDEKIKAQLTKIGFYVLASLFKHLAILLKPNIRYECVDTHTGEAYLRLLCDQVINKPKRLGVHQTKYNVSDNLIQFEEPLVELTPNVINALKDHDVCFTGIGRIPVKSRLTTRWSVVPTPPSSQEFFAYNEEASREFREAKETQDKLFSQDITMEGLEGTELLLKPILLRWTWANASYIDTLRVSDDDYLHESKSEGIKEALLEAWQQNPSFGGIYTRKRDLLPILASEMDEAIKAAEAVKRDARIYLAVRIRRDADPIDAPKKSIVWNAVFSSNKKQEPLEERFVYILLKKKCIDCKSWKRMSSPPKDGERIESTALQQRLENKESSFWGKMWGDKSITISDDELREFGLLDSIKENSYVTTETKGKDGSEKKEYFVLQPRMTVEGETELTAIFSGIVCVDKDGVRTFYSREEGSSATVNRFSLFEDALTLPEGTYKVSPQPITTDNPFEKLKKSRLVGTIWKRRESMMKQYINTYERTCKREITRINASDVSEEEKEKAVQEAIAKYKTQKKNVTAVATDTEKQAVLKKYKTKLEKLAKDTDDDIKVDESFVKETGPVAVTDFVKLKSGAYYYPTVCNDTESKVISFNVAQDSDEKTHYFLLKGTALAEKEASELLEILKVLSSKLCPEASALERTMAYSRSTFKLAGDVFTLWKHGKAGGAVDKMAEIASAVSQSIFKAAEDMPARVNVYKIDTIVREFVFSKHVVRELHQLVYQMYGMERKLSNSWKRMSSPPKDGEQINSTALQQRLKNKEDSFQSKMWGDKSITISDDELREFGLLDSIKENSYVTTETKGKDGSEKKEYFVLQPRTTDLRFMEFIWAEVLTRLNDVPDDADWRRGRAEGAIRDREWPALQQVSLLDLIHSMR